MTMIKLSLVFGVLVILGIVFLIKKNKNTCENRNKVIFIIYKYSIAQVNIVFNIETNNIYYNMESYQIYSMEIVGLGF